MLNIYVIRHGEAEHNIDRSVMAHTHDSRHSLTKVGQKQASMTGQFMKDNLNEKTVIYSSPYLRTMQTARAVHSLLPNEAALFQNPLLREWELGNLYDFTNRTEEEKKEFKAAGQFYFRYQNGESLADVYLRATMFMNTVHRHTRSFYSNAFGFSHELAG